MFVGEKRSDLQQQVFHCLAFLNMPSSIKNVFSILMHFYISGWIQIPCFSVRPWTSRSCHFTSRFSEGELWVVGTCLPPPPCARGAASTAGPSPAAASPSASGAPVTVMTALIVLVLAGRIQRLANEFRVKSAVFRVQSSHEELLLQEQFPVRVWSQDSGHLDQILPDLVMKPLLKSRFCVAVKGRIWMPWFLSVPQM